MNQISRHRRQPIGSALRPEVLDQHVVAVCITGFAQPIEKGRQFPNVTLRRSRVDKPDHPQRRLLRSRFEGPGRRTAERGNEFSPCDVGRHRTLHWSHAHWIIRRIARLNLEICDALHSPLRCPLLAQCRRAGLPAPCPLSGVKRTSTVGRNDRPPEASDYN